MTPSNKSDLLDLRAAFLSSSQTPLYLPYYGPCSAVHPPLSSCLSVPLDRFFTVSKWMMPIYGALHFIPAVVFRRKAFTQDPGKVLFKAALGSLRSSAFLGVFVVIYQGVHIYFVPVLVTSHLVSLSSFILWKTQLASIPHTIAQRHNSCFHPVFPFQRVPSMDNKSPYFQRFLCYPRSLCRVIPVRRRKKEERGACNVRFAQRVGECVGYGERERLGV